MLYIFLLLLCVATAAEMFLRKGAWAPRLLNLQLFAINMVTIAVLAPLLKIAIPFSLVDGPLWLIVPLFVLSMDLGEYLVHRAQHKFAFLWRFHSLHHSDENMSSSTTFRTHVLDMVAQNVVITAFASLLVHPTEMGVLAYTVATLWKMLAHSAINFDFGRWNWLLTSSAYHRRHHSRLPEHFDSNFAAIFPIYDVICGAYRKPEGYPPTGLDATPKHIGQALLWPAKYATKAEETAAPAFT